MWEIDIVHILHKEMWNNIHHLYGVFSYVHINFSCSYTYCHNFITYAYLPYNKSSYDSYNFFQNKKHCHTFHNTIPENMLHMMKMMNINMYTKSWFWA